MLITAHRVYSNLIDSKKPKIEKIPILPISSPIQTLTVGHRFSLCQPHEQSRGSRTLGHVVPSPSVGNFTLPRRFIHDLFNKLSLTLDKRICKSRIFYGLAKNKTSQCFTKMFRPTICRYSAPQKVRQQSKPQP